MATPDEAADQKPDPDEPRADDAPQPVRKPRSGSESETPPGRQGRRGLGRRARSMGRWLAALAVCYVGGVAATNLSPTTVTTQHYATTLRISPLPHRTPTLSSPTILGDIDLRFRAPVLAPSIDASVQVRGNITSVLESRSPSVEDLRPSEEELNDALESALLGVGARFLAGSLLTALIVSAALAYGRRRPPGLAHLVHMSTAAASALALTAGGMATAYQPDRFETFRATGLLGELQRHSGILGDVSDRASAAGPYVRNLLALSQALQSKFAPAQTGTPSALRVLVVSDLHGANYYPLLRTIIAEEHIDLVIDSGDIVNFGTAQELDVSKMSEGIASLGVPYVFVRGNHDATSATDTAVLTRLATIPNVVLLQPPGGGYTAYAFRGLRIAGFNDSRWFGDANPSQADSQGPLVEAFDRAFTHEPEPDVLVTHEPYAAEHAAKGSIRINGHMHTAELVGNRIQAGTLTGGGVVSHFVEQKAGGQGELTGQPYSFDVLAFAGDCRLTTLSRYQFSGIVEGRPVYDNVQVVNGSTIQASVPEDSPAPRPDATVPASGSTSPAAGPTGAPDAGSPRTCGAAGSTTEQRIQVKTS